MPPGELLQWERVLQSPVAVLLLLLAGQLAQFGVMAKVILTLWRINQDQSHALQKVLRERGDFSAAVRNARRLLTLRRERPDARADQAP